MNMAEQSSVQSVERTFKLVEILSEKGALGITELSVLSGLNKTTVYRLLSTLVNLGYVRKKTANEKYELTLKFLRLSADTLSKIDFRHTARPYLEKIPAKTGETVHLVERIGNDIIYIDKFESAVNSVRMVSRIGFTLPMIYTAVGKAIMAKLTDKEIEKIWNESEIIAKTDKTVTDFTEFMKEIEIVRKRGYATDLEENESGVCCVAAALTDMYGEYKYAFSVSAPVTRIDDKKIAEIGLLITETAQKISGTE